MSWTATTRPHYARSDCRYASDLTDKEWDLIKDFMPIANLQGRPRRTNLRQVMEAILYRGKTGCQWRRLARDFPPGSTVQRYFYDWRDSGLLKIINHDRLL